MKICNYCGAENSDKTTKCKSCGASSFMNKCQNCGTAFSEGTFCPRCGVQIGQKSKTCPNCRKVYYSNACPDCGYTGEKAKQTKAAPVNVVTETRHVEEEKKKITIGTIALWIFFFPIMATRAIWRSKRMSMPLKILLLALMWYCFLSAFKGNA